MAALDKDNNTQVSTKPIQNGSDNSQNPAADIVNKNQTPINPANPINLLPDEFKPKKSVLNLSKKLNRVALASLIVFLILGITSLISIFVINTRANSIEEEVARLSAEVEALEQTEQRLVLIRNRVNQVDQIRTDSGSLYDKVVTYKNIYDNLPGGLEILKANIEGNRINTEISFNNSSDLARFLSQTVTSDQYQLVNIESLTTGTEGGLVMIISLGT